MESNVKMQEDAPLFSSVIGKTLFARGIASTDSNTLLDPQGPAKLDLPRQTLDGVPTVPTWNGPAPMLLHENEDINIRANSDVAVSGNDDASRSGDDRTKLNEAASTQLATRFEDLSIAIERLKEGVGKDSSEPALPTSFKDFVSEFLRKDSKWGEYNEGRLFYPISWHENSLTVS
jgi:hypothetical protein